MEAKQMARYFRLDEKRLEQAIKEMEYNLAMENYARCADTWQGAWGTRDAILEMPLGELTNEGIAGFVWAWNAKHMIKTADIDKHDRFNAQGLEGKVIIETIMLIDVCCLDHVLGIPCPNKSGYALVRQFAEWHFQDSIPRAPCPLPGVGAASVVFHSKVIFHFLDRLL